MSEMTREEALARKPLVWEIKAYRPDDETQYEKWAREVIDAEALYKRRGGTYRLTQMKIPAGNPYVMIKQQMWKQNISFSDLPLGLSPSVKKQGGMGHLGMRFRNEGSGIKGTFHPYLVPLEKEDRVRDLGIKAKIEWEARKGGAASKPYRGKMTKGRAYTEVERQKRADLERGLRQLRRKVPARNSYMNVIDPVSAKLEESFFYALREQFGSELDQLVGVDEIDLQELFRRAHQKDTVRATKALQGGMRRLLNNQELSRAEIHDIPDVFKHARGANIAAITNKLRFRDTGKIASLLPGAPDPQKLISALRYDLLRKFDMTFKNPEYQGLSVMEAVEYLSKPETFSHSEAVGKINTKRDWIEKMAKDPEVLAVFNEIGGPGFEDRWRSVTGPLVVPLQGPVLGGKTEGNFLKKPTVDDALIFTNQYRGERADPNRPRPNRAARGAYRDPVETRFDGPEVLSDVEREAARRFDDRLVPKAVGGDVDTSVLAELGGDPSEIYEANLLGRKVPDSARTVRVVEVGDDGKINFIEKKVKVDKMSPIQIAQRSSDDQDVAEIIRTIEDIPNPQKRLKLYIEYRKLLKGKHHLKKRQARLLNTLISNKYKWARKNKAFVPGLLFGLLAPTIAAGVLSATSGTEEA